MRRLCLIAVLILVAVTTVSPALAPGEQLEIPWFTIDAGGTTASCGGGYCLSGSMGHPLAGASSDAVYALQGGFWAVAAAPGTGSRAIYLPLIRKSGAPCHRTRSQATRDLVPLPKRETSRTE